MLCATCWTAVCLKSVRVNALMYACSFPLCRTSGVHLLKPWLISSTRQLKILLELKRSKATWMNLPCLSSSEFVKRSSSLSVRSSSTQRLFQLKWERTKYASKTTFGQTLSRIYTRKIKRVKQTTTIKKEKKMTPGPTTPKAVARKAKRTTIVVMVKLSQS
jgi:hypothetical protein